MKRLIFIVLLVIATQWSNAQVTLQAVLDSIATNSLQIKASRDYLDAEIALSGVGLTLADPQVEYGWFPGNNPVLGNKATTNISQSFYFPTVYALKKTGAKLTTEKMRAIHSHDIRNILVQAASQYLEWVYLEKYSSELKRRVENADSVKTLVEKRMMLGDADQIELNKVRTEVLNQTNALNLGNARREEKIQALIALNGGRVLTLTEPGYPLWPLIPADSVLSAAFFRDPVIKAMEYEKQIAGNDIRLQRSLRLPQFKAGYGQETVLEGSYRGVQAGITVPLWQNRNSVNYARSYFRSAESNQAAYKHQLENSVYAKYRVVETLFKNLESYRDNLDNLQSAGLLKKSLESGNISVLDYYRELSSWYDTYDRFLVTERDYHLEMLQFVQYLW